MNRRLYPTIDGWSLEKPMVYKPRRHTQIKSKPKPEPFHIYHDFQQHTLYHNAYHHKHGHRYQHIYMHPRRTNRQAFIRPIGAKQVWVFQKLLTNKDPY